MGFIIIYYIEEYGFFKLVYIFLYDKINNNIKKKSWKIFEKISKKNAFFLHFFYFLFFQFLFFFFLFYLIFFFLFYY